MHYLTVQEQVKWVPYVAVGVATLGTIIGATVLLLVVKCFIAVCLRILITPRPLKQTDKGADPIYANDSTNRGFVTSELYYNVIARKSDKHVHTQASPRSPVSNEHYYVGMHPAKRDSECVGGPLTSDTEQPYYSSVQASKDNLAKNSTPFHPPKDSHNYELVHPVSDY